MVNESRTIEALRHEVGQLRRLVAMAHEDPDLEHWMIPARARRQGMIEGDFDRGVDEGLRRAQAFLLLRAINTHDSAANTASLWDVGMEIGGLQLDQKLGYQSLVNVEARTRAECAGAQPAPPLDAHPSNDGAALVPGLTSQSLGEHSTAWAPCSNPMHADELEPVESMGPGHG